MENTRPDLRRCDAFTLIELLTALAVVSICLAIAIPGWQHLAEQNRINVAVNNYIGLMHYARNQAVKQHQDVTLCPSTDSDSCSTRHSDWSAGFMVFVDSNRNRRRDRNERILRTALYENEQLTIETARSRRALKFRPDGSAWGSNTTMRFCGRQAEEGNRAVVLLGTGRPRVSDRLPNGQAIACS